MPAGIAAERKAGSARSLGPDFKVAAALFVIAALIGMVFVSTFDGTPSFYQRELGPAVMLVCGRGLTNPVFDDVPALAAFLRPAMRVNHAPEVDCFDCAQLPSNIQTVPLDSYQVRHQYLIYTVALCWKLFGVSWSALTPLYGIFFGAGAVALYAVFRIAAGRGLAALCVFLLTVSPVQLNNLVRLRDYSKAPFLIAAMAIMAHIVARPQTRRSLLLWSAACGAVLGIGYGFRMDTMIAVPAFAVIALCFAQCRKGLALAPRLFSVLLMLAIYVLTSLPPQSELSASQKYHHLIMGFSDIYDQRLGVGAVPYDIAHRYFDAEPLVITQAFSKYRDGEYTHFRQSTEAYETAGADYTRILLRTFPADIMFRSLAAVLRTIDELGSNPAAPAPRTVTNRFVLSLYEVHAHAMQFLLRYARYLVPLALLALGMIRLRYGFAAGFMLFYFCGYGAIQFASRHYFHLQFMSLWAVALLLTLAWHTAQRMRKPETREACRLASLAPAIARAPALRRALIFATLAVAALAIPLCALRCYQQGQIRPLLAAYEEAECENLFYTKRPLDAGRVLVQGVDGGGAEDLPRPCGPPYFAVEFLVASFDTQAGAVQVSAEYRGSRQDLLLAWSTTLPQTESRETQLYFPAYTVCFDLEPGQERDWAHYRGLCLSAEAAARFRGLRRVSEPEQFPLLLTATLSPGWEARPLWQRLIR